MPQPPERVLVEIEQVCVRAGHPCVVVSASSARLARAASHRLMRGGGRTRLWVKDPSLVLDRLDLPAFELMPADEDALRALGVNNAAQLRALMDAGGTDRLGAAAVDVTQLFSLIKEPVDSVPVPVRIVELVELEEPLAEIEPLMFLLSRLCERCVWRTQARRERVAEMTLSLLRKRSAPTMLMLAFPAPLSEHQPVLRALMARLERLQLEAPFDVVHLEVTRRAVASPQQLPLDPHERARDRIDRELLHLMAEMQAELGVERVGSLAITDDVRPEKMTAVVTWPPPRSSLRQTHKPRRRIRQRQAAHVADADASTAQGRFLAAWPWPVRLLPVPERLSAQMLREVKEQQLLGVLEGEDATDQAYQRHYVVMHFADGRRALILVDRETDERLVCGWFD
jgi:hypothetical protein